MSLAERVENVQEKNITVIHYSSEKPILVSEHANKKLIYSLIESECDIEDQNVITYGIEIECSLFGYDEKSKILNITSNIEMAKELFDLIACNAVTPISLKDIVEDFLEEKYGLS